MRLGAQAAHNRADRLRQLAEPFEQMLQRHLSELGVVPCGGVKVVHERRMLAAMVDLRGLGVDVRLVRGRRVGQRRQAEGATGRGRLSDGAAGG